MQWFNVYFTSLRHHRERKSYVSRLHRRGENDLLIFHKLLCPASASTHCLFKVLLHRKIAVTYDCTLHFHAADEDEDAINVRTQYTHGTHSMHPSYRALFKCTHQELTVNDSVAWSRYASVVWCPFSFRTGWQWDNTHTAHGMVRHFGNATVNHFRRATK